MSRFHDLLDGYLHNSLSPSELEEFLALVEENPDPGLILPRHFADEQSGFTDKAQRDKMLANVWARARDAGKSVGDGDALVKDGGESVGDGDGAVGDAGKSVGDGDALVKDGGESVGDGDVAVGDVGKPVGDSGKPVGDVDECAEGTRQGTGIERNRRVISLWRWSAAAIVLILLGTAGELLLHRDKKAAVAIKAFRNDVAPGRMGAVLQLADGSTIALDSAGKGVIARQGGSQVVNQGNGGVVYVNAGRNAAILFNKLSTGKGRQYQLTLPDGTKVWLNSSSSIRYPIVFTNERRVEVTGEAYFEVTPNASKPFFVKAAQQDIRVLGTSFNVNVYEDEPVKRTTLLRGAITVNNALLSPGKEAATDKRGLTITSVNAADAIAWKNGFFQFDNADLPTVMRQIARWYDVDVKYEGPVPAWGDFKGQIGRDLSLAQVLKILEQTRVHFRIEEDKRIVIFR